MLNRRKKTIGTQTGMDLLDVYVPLSPQKHFKIYYSESYQDYVLSFNINTSKAFIITRQMWQIFKIYYSYIDKVLVEKKND